MKHIFKKNSAEPGKMDNHSTSSFDVTYEEVELGSSKIKLETASLFSDLTSGNVMIPGSTLDLFFENFNSIKKTPDDIESGMRGASDFPPTRTTSESAASVGTGLESILSSPEALISNLKSELQESRKIRQSLVDENVPSETS